MAIENYAHFDREIMDTIRVNLFAYYSNAEDGREFTSEELEAAFATDEAFRAWLTNQAGINPDTLAAITPTGHAIINVSANTWVAQVRGLHEDDAFRLILAGLKNILQ